MYHKKKVSIPNEAQPKHTICLRAKASKYISRAWKLYSGIGEKIT